MKKRLLLLFTSLLMLHVSFGQCNLRVSLLTCAPGAELYSIFGHTALRVQDDATGTDWVFNYGTFEFGPDFYPKFVRGKLLYYLSVEDMRDFLWQYRAESRSIVEQELNLSCSEKEKLYTALQVNAREENRYYRYDFLFDNCTTRAGDMAVANSDGQVQFKNILDGKAPSFRNLIHTYLDAGHQYWSKLGIDLLLGAKVDRKVTNREAMFLPDYLMKGFDSAYVDQKPLVANKSVILQMPSPLPQASVFTPLLVFTVLLVLVVAATMLGPASLKRALRVFDVVYFLALGIVGLLILFMWLGTDHVVTRSNYNILWALPTHLLGVFFIFKSTNWRQRYFTGVLVLNMLLLAGWFFLPQQMNPGFLPLVLLSAYRSYVLSKAAYGTKGNQIPG